MEISGITKGRNEITVMDALVFLTIRGPRRGAYPFSFKISEARRIAALLTELLAKRDAEQIRSALIKSGAAKLGSKFKPRRAALPPTGERKCI
jgi:hypothetical protein